MSFVVLVAWRKGKVSVGVLSLGGEKGLTPKSESHKTPEQGEA